MESPYKSPEAQLDVPGGGVNSSGHGKDAVLPDGVAGWSWGAFFLNWIWAAFNRTYIGLLALVPYVGFIMAIVLGVKGREWAWQNKRWESVEHFNAVQRRWSFWGVVLTLGVAGLGIVAAIMLPAFVGTMQATQ
jgi:hypothetical protein